MKKNILIILAVLIVAAIGVSVKVFKPQKAVAPASESAAFEKPYTNEKGEKWGPLMQNAYLFQVASAESAEPKFLEGKIDPLDVHVGDVQKFRIVVQSPAGIKSVIAEIETDNGEVKVSLSRTGRASIKDMFPPRYKVDGWGTLNILTQKQIAEKVERELAKERVGVLGKASAAEKLVPGGLDGEKEVWEGEWVVRDTHVRNYHTTFVAEDLAGRTNSLTMAWSDPCNLPATGGGPATLRNPCVLGAGETDGWDGGNLEIAPGVDLGLQSNSTFVWNNGNSITVNGSIYLSPDNTSKLSRTYLYYTDTDGDRYASNSTKRADSNLSLSGYVRRSSALGVNDCYEANPATTNAELAFPGQTQYFSVNRGDGSFDYNCDTVQTVQYPPTIVPSCTCELARVPDLKYLASLSSLAGVQLAREATPCRTGVCTTSVAGTPGFNGPVGCGGIDSLYYKSWSACAISNSYCSSKSTSDFTHVQACR